MADDVAETRRLLGDSVAGFVAANPGPTRIRRLRGTRPGVDRTVWRAMAEAGWLGLRLPETRGGSGLGVGELATVLEGLGRGLAPEPVATALAPAVALLTRVPTSVACERLLESIVGGALLPSLAWQERANDDTARPEATRLEGGRLAGRKLFVAAASAADGFLVTAATLAGPALCWVAAGAENLDVALDDAIDGGVTGTLVMSGTEAEVIAAGSDLAAAVELALDEARLGVAAELIGVMSAGLDITLAFVRQRVQFGQAIGSFQALQHRLVDLWMQRELANASLRRAVAAFDGEPRGRALAVAAAKARASDAALLIGRQGIQMHGGMGYTDACDIGLCLKRAVALSACLGNGTAQRRRYAALDRQAA